MPTIRLEEKPGMALFGPETPRCGPCVAPIMAGVAKWKPARARKKESQASTGRLVSCLLLVVTGLILFFVLFAAILKR